MSSGYVYAIGDQHGRVKIGYTSNSPESRMAAMQTGNADELELLYSGPGTLHHESFLHEKLADFHVRGEWFLVDEYRLFYALRSVLGEVETYPYGCAFCGFTFDASDFFGPRGLVEYAGKYGTACDPCWEKACQVSEGWLTDKNWSVGRVYEIYEMFLKTEEGYELAR